LNEDYKKTLRKRGGFSSKSNWRQWSFIAFFGHNEIEERRRRSADFENNFVSLQKRLKKEKCKVLTINALRNALKKVAICMHYLANFG
jgi:hypothetical protein